MVMAMVSRPIAYNRAGSARHLALWCLLVLGLVLSHHALMLTMRHVEVMAPQHGTVGAGAVTLPHSVAEERAAPPLMPGHESTPSDGHTLLGDCPVVQAILPGLLLLLLAASLAALAGGRPSVTAGAAMQPTAPHPPPPRSASEHRALLQVFRI